jgi:hypothetical protein
MTVITGHEKIAMTGQPGKENYGVKVRKRKAALKR